MVRTLFSAMLIAAALVACRQPPEPLDPEQPPEPQARAQAAPGDQDDGESRDAQPAAIHTQPG